MAGREGEMMGARLVSALRAVVALPSPRSRRGVGGGVMLALVLGLAGCAVDDDASQDGAAGCGGVAAACMGAPDYAQAGPYPVGHEVFTLADPARSRTLTVQVWYPADESARGAADAGVAIDELVPDATQRAAVAGLVAAAPERCTSRRTRSAPGVLAAPGAHWPLVVFSHCHGCLRFSSFSVAERLASHGIAVVAPDHAGGSLYESLDGTSAGVDDTFLAVRVGDVRAVLDAMLDGRDAVPASVRGRFDAAHVGMMGHSFGAVTTGKVLVDDDRFKAGFAMAAPPAFLGGVTMPQIAEPILMLLATEDHSIGLVGNSLMHDNFDAATSPAWLAEVRDAGHWSFSDVCALTKDFTPGCGSGERQEDHTDFTYLDIDQGRSVAASYAAAYFDWALRGAESGRAYVSGNHPDGTVAVTAK